MNIKLNQKSSGGRTLVNLLGIPSIILMVFLGGIPFLAFITIVSLLSLREFFLLGVHKRICPQFIIGYIVTFLIILQFYFGPSHPFTIFRHGEILLLVTPAIILFELFRGKTNPLSNILFTLGGILYIPFLLGSLVALRHIDPITTKNGNKVDSLPISWSLDL
ncbi:MAG: phosphatidate cytidylyltransferase [Candidatus Neomarinimicrobiota bacterium]